MYMIVGEVNGHRESTLTFGDAAIAAGDQIG